METRMNDQITIVTGAARGIGRAIAERFGAEGENVILADLETESAELVAEGIIKAGGKASVITTDVSDESQGNALFDHVMDTHGSLDVLVNNARAIIGKDKVPVTELDLDVWQHFLSINTTAAFLVTKFVARHMIHAGNGGRIINIASNAGKQASANGAAYSASKFAVIGLTQASAMDLASHNITVNAVCPGPINTDRMSYWERDQAAEKGITQEEFRGQIVENSSRNTPLGRIAEPHDVANMVSFLAGDEASFITGQAYNVNGGQLFH